MTAHKPLSAAQAIIYGWLVVGTLDITDAIVVSLVRGGTPVRMLRGIASGLLGRASFDGGIPTAVLGLCIHFFIAFVVVSTYYLASRRITVLTRYPLICGPIYGLLVYAVMYRVVMPLSAIGVAGQFVWPRSLNDLAIHAFGVGLPSAWFASLSPPAETHDALAASSDGAATHG
jgi:hypothetical protein